MGREWAVSEPFIRYAVAQREGHALSQSSRFEGVVEEVAAAMPGVREAIAGRSGGVLV